MNAIESAVIDSSRLRKRAAPKGRQVAEQARAEVLATVGAGPYRRDLLIEYLHLLQDKFGQLATPHLAALAQAMKLSQSEVFEVATFYHHFDVVREDADGEIAQVQKLTVRVCNSLSCELAGAAALLEKLPKLLGKDVRGANVRVQAVPCVGRCEQAPAAVVGQHALAQASCESVAAAVQSGQTKPTVAAYEGLPAYVANGGYGLLRECMSGARSAESVLATLDDSGLQGLGGAGFAVGRKWRIVKNQPGPRLMAVNIDEGEPGTFKDRVLLEATPHRFLEGMLIAAWAVGIDAIYIYLRDEYHGGREILLAEIAALHALQLPLPTIELRRGAGAYICGEESAMIESIEGKRGLPRLRPPYVAQTGLFGRPTLVHNFESLHWVPELLQNGAASFTRHGRNGSKGLRRFSVSGRVREPGVKLAPAGITALELIDEYCGGMLPGHRLYAYLPGGASGGILPASLANLPLDFGTLQAHGCFIGSAAVVVLSESNTPNDLHRDTAVAAAQNTLRFFEHESCGQCTPCRAGTAKARVLSEQAVWDKTALQDLSQVMRDASICGLGQAAPNPFDCVMRYFPHELT